MNKQEIIIDSDMMEAKGAIDLLTGAYALEFDIDLPEGEGKSLATELRQHLRDHIGFQPDTTGDNADPFRWKFHHLKWRLEQLGFDVLGTLKLVSTGLEGKTPLPTAMFSLVARVEPEPEPEGSMLDRVKTLSRQDFVDNLDDPEHFVFWMDIKPNDYQEYLEALNSAKDEREIHAYLKAHRIILVQPFSSGHGRWVYPSFWLGKDHEIDFLVLTKDSSGYVWTMIELEPPNAAPFLNDGKMGQRLREAIQQVDSWRLWLASNLDTARRSKDDKGLGLTDITSRTKAYIIIGRESAFPKDKNEWRRLKRDDGIEIHSYDWLARNALGSSEGLTFEPPKTDMP